MPERSLIPQERILSQEKGLTCFEGRDETLPITSFGQTKPYQSFVECCNTCKLAKYAMWFFASYLMYPPLTNPEGNASNRW